VIIAPAVQAESGCTARQFATATPLERVSGLTPETQLQESDFLLIYKLLNVVAIIEEQRNNLSRCAITKSDPDHFGRSASQDAEPMEVLIFGDEHAIVLQRQLPDVLV
jgi:hypothetical protein